MKSLILEDLAMYHEFNRLTPPRQQEFLDFCTGERGVKILYDPFFKEIHNPEYNPERLESLLSNILKQQVRILQVLPNDSTRIAVASALGTAKIVLATKTLYFKEKTAILQNCRPSAHCLISENTVQTQR